MKTFKQWLAESTLTGEAMRMAADEIRKHLAGDFRNFAQDYTVDVSDIVWEMRIEYEDNDLLDPKIYDKILTKALKASGVTYTHERITHTFGTKIGTKFCRLSVRVPK